MSGTLKYELMKKRFARGFKAMSAALALFAIFVNCTDPIRPEFELREGLVFIEGFVSTVPGASFVTIERSALEIGAYVVNFVGGATVSFQDPPDRENYYYWTYRTYENLVICQRCVQGYFREGACQSFPPDTGIPFYDYLCANACWPLRFHEHIAIFDDKFSNGKQVTDLSIGNLPLYTKENMVLVVQQFALTPSAYEYYEILKDIVDDSSSLNAPPPAGLVGNVYNSEDRDKFVFGRFTAAATSETSIYIDRSTIQEEILEVQGPTFYEPQGGPAPPPVTGIVACLDNRFRTAIPPPGWINNQQSK